MSTHVHPAKGHKDKSGKDCPLSAVVEPGGRQCRQCKADSARDLCDKCFSAGVEFGHAHPDYTPETKP